MALFSQLLTDLATLQTAAGAFDTAAAAVQTDLTALPAAKEETAAPEGTDSHRKAAKDDPDAVRAAMAAHIEIAGSHPFLQQIICAALPILNLWLATHSLPPLPTPAFCAPPTPTKKESK